MVVIVSLQVPPPPPPPPPPKKRQKSFCTDGEYPRILMKSQFLVVIITASREIITPIGFALRHYVLCLFSADIWRVLLWENMWPHLHQLPGSFDCVCHKVTFCMASHTAAVSSQCQNQPMVLTLLNMKNHILICNWHLCLTDIDECSINNGSCEYGCVNTPAVTSVCPPGQTLHWNKKDCVGESSLRSSSRNPIMFAVSMVTHLACPSEAVKCLPNGKPTPRAQLSCIKTGGGEVCSLSCLSNAFFLAG